MNRIKASWCRVDLTVRLTFTSMLPPHVLVKVSLPRVEKVALFIGQCVVASSLPSCSYFGTIHYENFACQTQICFDLPISGRVLKKDI